MAELAWKIGVAIVFLAVVLLGLIDLILLLGEQETITRLLRRRPELFWGPVSLLALAVLALTLHLYVGRWLNGR